VIVNSHCSCYNFRCGFSSRNHTKFGLVDSSSGLTIYIYWIVLTNDFHNSTQSTILLFFRGSHFFNACTFVAFLFIMATFTSTMLTEAMGTFNHITGFFLQSYLLCP
jgi:hypothetical protein